LYALRECFKEEYGLSKTSENVYGVLSLVVWSLILVVSVKYLIFILRADNQGEGGILALLALILQQNRGSTGRPRQVMIALGLIGAALLYGDGVITPAISVLGAMEGLEVVTPRLQPVVVPMTLGILICLFLVQKKGTAKVGRIFGPVMAVWFFAIAGLGIKEIAHVPGILLAVNPVYALDFFVAHGRQAFVLLGAVVLVVTGGEALYADMGHFGARPIRLAWFSLVLPALLLNYFGQGALMLRDPAAGTNPFFLLAPRVLLYPLVVLATTAAIIASQALISGAFSLTQQAVQLGYSPRVNIVHTSKSETGQIYIPEVNTALMVGCVLVVLGFRSSGALGAAYGIAVTGTMSITTILFYIFMRQEWHWSIAKAGALCGLFLAVDLAFFGANILKILHGGWVPLFIGVVIFSLMTTWNRGRRVVRALLSEGSLPVDLFMQSVADHPPVRVEGTAVFMTSDPRGVPLVLLHHLKHNKVLHQEVILLSILSEKIPEIPETERLTVEPLPHGFWRIAGRYGFMEAPNVLDVLSMARPEGLEANPLRTTFYLGREQLIINRKKKVLATWRKRLYVFMSRNSRSATEFFGIPPNRVVELGAQLEF
jgi:KUP system potassium uptake protein